MYNKTIAQVRNPLVLSRLKDKWEFFGKWADWCIARNNDGMINKHREEAWYGDGCNLMAEMADDARSISEWKDSQHPGGREMRKRPRGPTVFRQKGAREIGPPEE